MRPRLFSLLLCCLYCFALGAQSEQAELFARYNNTELHDTVRLSALHKLAKEHYLRISPDSAFLLAQEQLEFAREVGNGHYEGEALNTQGVSWAMRADMQQALGLFQASLQAYRRAGELLGQGNAWYNIGEVYSRTGMADSSLACMERSLRIYEQVGDHKGLARSLHGLARYSDHQGRYDQALEYFQRSIETSTRMEDTALQVVAMVNMSGVYKQQGDFSSAIDILNRALRLAEQLQDGYHIYFCLAKIGEIYDRQGDHAMALRYFERGLEESRRSSDVSAQRGALLNMGNALSNLGRSQEALVYYLRTAELAGQSGEKSSQAIALNNLSRTYADLGQYELALESGLQSLELKRQAGFDKGVPSSLISVGNVYLRAGQPRKALPYSREGLELAQKQGDLTEQRNAAQDLWQIYKSLGMPEASLAMHERYIVARDSLEREENQRAVLRQEYRYTYEKRALADSLEYARQNEVKDLELARQQANLSRQRTALFSSGGGLLLLLALAYSIFRGKKRSDELLHNILPEEVAAELKAKGEAEPRLMDSVSVLFTDFKGFTEVSEKLSPRELVNAIHTCFSAFDQIVEQHGLEKIKTIGDAYMAACGVPLPRPDHAVRTAQAALAMLDFMGRWAAERQAAGLPSFQVRIGIHSGPVVAGIVGVKKFAYDIWGDAVNTASRMESSGEAGQVNISGSTYAQLKNQPGLRFTHRGEVQTKGKGELEMWFVERLP